MNKQSLAEIYKRDENKKLLFTYAMAKRVIQIVKKYLDKTKQNTLDFYEREGNIIAIYIIYGRMFSNNIDLPQLKIKKMPIDLTEDEKSLHYSLINLRNKVFAHSDATMNNIQICLTDGKLEAVPTHPTTLIEEYADLASSLFNKIESAIDDKLTILLNDLYAQNNGYKITDENYVLLGYNNDFWERYLIKKFKNRV